MSANTTALAATSATNPYQLEELFVTFHRTPAGIAWRWRTELAILTILAAVLWRLSLLITLTWAGIVLAAFVGLVLGVPHSRRFITRRFWCVLARHRLHRLCYEARLHTRAGRLPARLVDPAHPGRRTGLGAVPGRHLRRGLRRPRRRAARRLLRPRRAGHPQPPMVPPGDHRHHPPRHPRGQQHHHLPAGAADRALPAPPRPGPRPPISPTSTARRHNPIGGPPGARPGDRPRPASKGGICHDHHHGHPAADAGAHVPVLHVRPGAPGHRRVRRTGLRQPGRTQHADRRRARRRQILRRAADRRARRAVA